MLGTAGNIKFYMQLLCDTWPTSATHSFPGGATYGPIKFVHCVRPCGDDRRVDYAPYDLLVIQAAEAAAVQRQPTESFAISATGVVRICKGQPSEFTSLPEWMHQSLMYHVLKSMRFFKYFLQRQMLRSVFFSHVCHGYSSLAHSDTQTCTLFSNSAAHHIVQLSKRVLSLVSHTPLSTGPGSCTPGSVSIHTVDWQCVGPFFSPSRCLRGK